ncbi:hypothetical protein [Metabacillus sp. RGM 3146]|uniref:hypothetical protein n=1 Tax=Metabacillus sp. RGM 3146 TaxID=3401092 RepID=UPI003B9B3ADB
MKNQSVSLLEEMASRFFILNKEAKQIEEELKQLKKEFNDYFDHKAGSDQKGVLKAGKYQVQRQIRTTESYQEEEAVQKLEEANLGECLLVVKKPDKEKIEAAIKLGLLAEDYLRDLTIRKITKVITVKET